MACPICSKPADPKYRPFCSRRCADLDLGRWLRGDYVLPDREGDSDDLSSDRDGSRDRGLLVAALIFRRA